MNKSVFSTNFSKCSPNQLDTFIQYFTEEGFKSVLKFSGFLVNSVIDPLFHNPMKYPKEKMTKNDEAKFEEIKVKYSLKCKIYNLSFHVFKTNALKNILDVHGISKYYISKNIDHKRI